MSKGVSAECKRLKKIIADGEKQLAEFDEKITAGDNCRELIEQYTNLEHLNRKIVDCGGRTPEGCCDILERAAGQNH